MIRIHIVGRKNSGKTTLIVDLVRELSATGLRVATVKHTHHHHELDTPGKDSFRHREAGAAAVGILSPEMDAVFRPPNPQQCDADRYTAFEAVFADCDLVLVEGDSTTTASKVEVWRRATDQPPLALEDSSIVAVISDDSLDDCESSTPIWPRGNISELAERLRQIAADQACG